MAKTGESAESAKGKGEENAKAESKPTSPAPIEAGKPADATPAEQKTQQQQQQQQQQQITIDDSDVSASYANFCRVSSSPEELILDLGLNPNPYAAGQTIKVSQRIILNHYTAKRLLSALSMAVQRHEQAFGVLETDVRKRVRGEGG